MTQMASCYLDRAQHNIYVVIMPIPPPDPSSPAGALPRGEHPATWDEIVLRFGTNGHRLQLLAGLELMIEHLVGAGATALYLDGGFITESEEPKDYDACYDIDREALAQLPEPLQDTAWPRVAMKAAYLGEALPSWMIAETMPGRVSRTYRMYFQQEYGERKGIVVLDLRSW